jgi:hypothetical protein
MSMHAFTFEADKEAVEEVYNEAVALSAEGYNPYPGLNYVNGVVAALAWVLGESDAPPLELPGKD